MTAVRAYVGLGSNLGDRAANLWEAARRLARIDGGRLVAQSPLYETEPVGPVPQGWFLNAAVALDVRLDAIAVLRELKRIEREMGRRPSERWGPRLIDLDLLLYGSESISTDGLVVPHPEMWRRRFVLAPLSELPLDLPLQTRVQEALLSLPDGETARPYQPSVA